MSKVPKKLPLEEEERFKKEWERITGLWKRSGKDLGKIPLIAYDTTGKKYS